MDGLFGFKALHAGVRGLRFIFDPVAQGHGVFMLGRRGVERVGNTVLLGLAEVIDQSRLRVMVVTQVTKAPRSTSYEFRVRYILMKTSCVRSLASSADPAKR